LFSAPSYVIFHTTANHFQHNKKTESKQKLKSQRSRPRLVRQDSDTHSVLVARDRDDHQRAGCRFCASKTWAIETWAGLQVRAVGKRKKRRELLYLLCLLSNCHDNNCDDHRCISPLVSPPSIAAMRCHPGDGDHHPCLVEFEAGRRSWISKGMGVRRE
jgi:hypothetical protein